MNAITHISTNVSFTNLVAVAEGNTDLLTTHPRLRTGVRAYGEEAIIAAAIELVRQATTTEETEAVVKYELTVQDVEEITEEVNNRVINFTLTQRTEEQKKNKDLYRIFRSILNWSLIVKACENVYGKGDESVDMSIRAIRTAYTKLSKATLAEVYALLRSVASQTTVDIFVNGVNYLKLLLNIKGSLSSVQGCNFYANSVGITVKNGPNSVLVTADWFNPEVINKVRRVRIVGAKLDSTYVNKCMYLIKDGIVLDGMSTNDIYLALHMKEGKLEIIPTPTVNKDFPGLVDVQKTGFIEPGKFQDGMFTYYPTSPVQYLGLAEQKDGVFHSIADGKKFAARQEKLNKDRTDAVKVSIDNVVFLKDAPEGMENLFNTGCFYLATNYLMQYGVSRIVSNIQNGMLKGATNIAQLVDVVKGLDTSYICASSYKGGLAGVLNVKGYTYDLSQTITMPEGFEWETVLVNGKEAQAIVGTITVMITNPYTLHSYTTRQSSVGDVDFDTVDLEAVESLSDSYEEEREQSAVAEEMLNLSIATGGNIANIISEYKEKHGLRLKSPLTTVVSSDFEIVRNTYGPEEAKKLMQALLSHPLNKATNKRKYAFDIINNTYNVEHELELSTVVLKYLELKEEYSISGTNFNSCNRNFLLKLVEALGANLKGRGWIKIVHEDLAAYLPIGTALYGDLLKTSDKLDKVVTKKLLPRLLEILDFFSKQKTMHYSVAKVQLSKLELAVQWEFINKDFGRLKTKGKYLVALPGAWLKNKYDVCMPGRDNYVPKKSKSKSVKANMTKQPALFDGSFAGCRVFKDLPFYISEELRTILSCVVFVHPDYLLELQNDADGDLVRITFDSHILPMYVSNVLKQEGKKFFSDYIEGENDFVVKDTQKVHAFTPLELQKAIQDSCVAKMRVGAYTDRMHVVATHIDTLVGDRINEEFRRAVVRLYGVMVQECAMNTIKHNSNEENITVADSLTKFFMFMANKAGQNVGIGRAKRMVLEFLTERGYDFSEFGLDLVSATNLVVACTKLINEGYSVNPAEMHRRLFKNMPTQEGEYLRFHNTQIQPSEDSTFSVLFSELLKSI